MCAVCVLPHRIAALTEDEKREMFLKAREEMKTVPAPKKETTPKPKPATRHKATPTPKPKPKATPTPEATPEETPTQTPRPKKRVESAPKPSATPKSTVTPSPPRAPSPTEVRRPMPTEPPAPVVVEKSGYEAETGYAPAPPKHFWNWGSGPTYRYLTHSVRDEIDRARVKKRRWRYIVVHNSGTRQGNARIFDYYHRHTRRMSNGLAYHFVIGNGSSSGNGQIEVGNRWRAQLQGGHVHSDYLNNIAIGICLVGDFNRDQPTRAQLDATEELIRYLRLRVGKIDRRFAIVKPHRDINPPRWPTDCPGDRFPFSWFQRFD
jgi:hypothetical protein